MTPARRSGDASRVCRDELWVERIHRLRRHAVGSRSANAFAPRHLHADEVKRGRASACRAAPRETGHAAILGDGDAAVMVRSRIRDERHRHELRPIPGAAR